MLTNAWKNIEEFTLINCWRKVNIFANINYDKREENNIIHGEYCIETEITEIMNSLQSFDFEIINSNDFINCEKDVQVCEA